MLYDRCPRRGYLSILVVRRETVVSHMDVRRETAVSHMDVLREISVPPWNLLREAGVSPGCSVGDGVFRPVSCAVLLYAAARQTFRFSRV